MKIELDITKNTYDYLEESIKYFEIADEDGLHEEAFSDYSKKVKWKMAYIMLVQSFELLIKVGLKKVSGILIYENLDSPITERSKTVSGVKGIERLCNCKPKLITMEEKGFLKECIEIRNAYIHSEVMLETTELKPKYCKLYALFVKVNKLLGGSKDSCYQEIVNKYSKTHGNILHFSKGFVVFRNVEMPEAFKREFLKEIEENYKMGVFVDEKGVKYKRFKYGDSEWGTPIVHEYCPDCAASTDEYHYVGCDIERCPKCYRQFLSCDCELEVYLEKEREVH